MIEVVKINSEQQEFTVGGVAKATGLTVRTLQHYDNVSMTNGDSSLYEALNAVNQNLAS